MRESKQSNNHTASSKYSNNKDSNSISKQNDQLKKLLEKRDLEIAIRYRYLQPFILNYQLQ
ncbi:hypothetical protein [Garciella nitratireducens]|uniref:hypothetical protein n=1 Tax=Garciella nitratireducens TaxID=218205 RepID=UPI00117B232A|nr:hypothetical protein [Garciella nitratireducens]